MSASATVSGLGRSNPIEKDGRYLGNDQIEWTIDVKNGSTIGNAIVEDTLPAGLSIVDGSIEVYKITKSGDNWNTVGDPDKSHTTFPVTLGKLGENDAYRIKFKTDIDYSKVNSGNYLKDNGFTNIATLYDDKNELNDDDATVTITRDPILEKVEV